MSVSPPGYWLLDRMVLLTNRTLEIKGNDSYPTTSPAFRFFGLREEPQDNSIYLSVIESL